MTLSERFSLIVRTVGLILCLLAAAILFYAFLNLALGGPVSVVGLCIIGAPMMLIGLWLLRGASWLIAFAFPERDARK